MVINTGYDLANKFVKEKTKIMSEEKKVTSIEPVSNKDSELFEIKKELQQQREILQKLVSKDEQVHKQLDKKDEDDEDFDSDLLDEEGDSEWIM